MKTAEKSAHVDYLFLRQKSTDDLREVLRQDLENDGKETEYDLILAVMEELERREKESGAGCFTDTEEALAQLHEQISAASIEEEVSKASEREQIKRNGSRISTRSLWPRILGAAAAVALVVLVGTVTAKASGYNLWENLARWTKESIRLETEEQTFDYSLSLGELESTLLDCGISEPVLPKWLPEQYVFDDVYVSDSPMILQIISQGWAGEHSLLVQIIKQKDPNAAAAEYFEVAEGSLESYTVHGIEHTIAKNTDHLCILWKTGSIQVSLDFSDGNLHADAKKIIESVYKE